MTEKHTPEQIAREIADGAYEYGQMSPSYEELLRSEIASAIRSAVEAETERAAMVAQQWAFELWGNEAATSQVNLCQKIAAAIRFHSENPK